MKLHIAVLAAALSLSAAFAQTAASPTPATPSVTAPAQKAEPEKRPLTQEQATRMADIDATEAQLSQKLGELGQTLQKIIQTQRNEVWASACTALGWVKGGECQVDQVGRSIGHVVQEQPKPEPAPKK